MADNNSLLNWESFKHYDSKMDEVIQDINDKLNAGGYIIDSDLSGTSTNPVQNKVITEALETKANKDEIPTSLPANGGNADTVDGKHATDFTLSYVNAYKPLITSIVPKDGAVTLSWLPVDGATKYAVCTYDAATGKYTHLTNTLTTTSYTATGLTNGTEYTFLVQAYVNDAWSKFTTADHVYAIPVAVYTHPNGTAKTGNPTANQTPAFGGTFTVTQFTSNETGHIIGATDRTITIPSTLAASNQAGLIGTGTQAFSGDKGFRGSVLCKGATAYGTPQARNLASGTAAADTTNCPSGAWYGQHS